MAPPNPEKLASYSWDYEYSLVYLYIGKVYVVERRNKNTK
jgi:hypothetical protein